MMAYAHEPYAANYKFTSALPVQLLKALTPVLLPLIEGDGCDAGALDRVPLEATRGSVRDPRIETDLHRRFAPEILRREAASARLAPGDIGSQLHHRALGPAVGLNLVVQVLADAPVEVDQFIIHCLGRTLARGVDQFDHFAKGRFDGRTGHGGRASLATRRDGRLGFGRRGRAGGHTFQATKRAL